MDHGIQLNAWYTLSKAVGRGGQAIDELTTNLVQDATQPLSDVQLGPSARADARHKVTVSAIIQAPWGVTVSPIFRYRSATPIHIWYGYDNNARRRQQRPLSDRLPVQGHRRCRRAVVRGDGAVRDRQLRARRAAVAVEPPRRESDPDPDRHERRALRGGVQPLQRRSTRRSTSARPRRRLVFTGTLANHTANTVFMKPNAFAGDSGQPEQRVGQIGFRFTF